jgi:hypothetical protein
MVEVAVVLQLQEELGELAVEVMAVHQEEQQEQLIEVVVVVVAVVVQHQEQAVQA